MEHNNIFTEYQMQKPSKFISTLFKILDTDEYQQIVSFGEHDMGFRIINYKRFKKEVLSAEFNNTNFSSFLRQLNMYGFKLKKNQANQKEYYHLSFVKGQREDLSRINRKQKMQFQEVDNAFTLSLLQKNNRYLVNELEELKKQQQIMLQQIDLNRQIQQQLQKNLAYFLSTILNCVRNGDDHCQKIFLRFLNIIAGLRGEFVERIACFIEDGSIPEPPQLELESPIPFWQINAMPQASETPITQEYNSFEYQPSS